MNLEQVIRNNLKAQGKPTVETGDNFILTTCLNPKHLDKKPSFSVNTETGSSVCFTCGYRVNTDYWVDGVLDDEQLEEIDREVLYNNLFKDSYKTSEKIYKNTFPPMILDDLQEYRGLTKETINKFKLYKCGRGKYGDRIIFPINDNHFETRTLVDSPRKYVHSYGFSPKEFLYPSTLIEFKQNYVIIVEGIMDCISLNQDGLQSVCNFGVANNLLSQANITKMIELGIETIYLMFDEDKAGKKAEKLFITDETLREYFSVKPAKMFKPLSDFYKSGCKDYNEYINSV